MAEKIEKPTSKPSPADQEAARELEILAPERRAVVADRVVEMREPTWLESLELDDRLAPAIAELEQQAAELGPAAASPGAMARLIYRHKDVMLDMMALCAGVERAWIERLSDRDGQRLAMLFWTVNAHFFGRRLVAARAVRAAASRGRSSSAH